MKKDPYEGFEGGDKRPQYIIQGVAILFFLTSCWLAFLLLPSLFEHDVFSIADQEVYVNPSGEELRDIGIVILNHLLWMLGPFIVSGYLLRFRRLGLYLAVLLLAVASWRFAYIPLVLPGQVLLVGTWAVGTAVLPWYWENLV